MNLLIPKLIGSTFSIRNNSNKIVFWFKDLLREKLSKEVFKSDEAEIKSNLGRAINSQNALNNACKEMLNSINKEDIVKVKKLFSYW